MGMVLYHQDMLLGDSMFYDAQLAQLSSCHKQRVVLHPALHYAYAIGTDCLPYDVNEFEEIIQMFITGYINKEPITTWFPYINTPILVMTADQTFTLFRSNGLANTQCDKQIIRHRPDATVVFGSGAPAATLALNAGMDPVKALYEAELSDPHTGGDLFGVRRSILIPVTEPLTLDRALTAPALRHSPDATTPAKPATPEKPRRLGGGGWFSR